MPIFNANNNRPDKHEEFGEHHNHRPQEFTIIVNGRRFTLCNKALSFEEVIKLAFGSVGNKGTIAYTITYSYKCGHNHDNGIMAPGDVIKNIREGMVFNVTKTSRS